MDTTQYKYRVIWADDEIYDIIPDEICTELLKEQIEIIDRVTTGEELQNSVYKHLDILDAIIVDANFDARQKEVSDRIISGLRRAFELYRDLNYRQKRDIPFYLYTNRTDQFLFDRDDEDDKCSIKEIFEQTGRVFKKSGGYEDLMTLLKQEVDANETPLFQLRRTYSAEFAAAELVPGAQERLVEGLLFEFDDNAIYDDTSTYFNPIRMIWENLEDQCKQQNILPQIHSLNGMVDFLDGKEVEGYTISGTIMPKTLIRSLDYFLSITQDGSHDKKTLSIDVIRYVRDTKNINLFRSVLFIVMDLLLWYKEVSEKRVCNNWIKTYELEGEVKLKIQKDRFNKEHYTYYCKNFVLANKNISIEEGDVVGLSQIKNAIDNKFTFDDIDETGTKFIVDKCIYTYEVISKK